MQTSLLDGVLSMQLRRVGLPALPTSMTSGTLETNDPYAASSSTIEQLSGYGQLYSALAAFGDNLNNSSLTAQTMVNSDASVATATAGSGAPTGAYRVNVTQMAKAEVLQSAFSVIDPNTALFSKGSFTIQTGSYDTQGATFTAGSTEPVTVNVTNGSLSGIASAINNSQAGVTATVTQDSSGYGLMISSNKTGVANNFALGDFAPATDAGNPADGSLQSFLSLSFNESQAAQDAILNVTGAANTSVITELAHPEIQQLSSYVSDPSSPLFTVGTFTIQSGSTDPQSNAFVADESTAVTVNVTEGSLSGIAAAINNAKAGVTASVFNDSANGYGLKITSDSSGAAHNFSIGNFVSSPPQAEDPFASFKQDLATLTFTETQAASDAIYTANGTGVTITQASNDNIQLRESKDIVLSIKNTGTTEINIGTDFNSFLASAQNVVNSYNAVRGTISKLTGQNALLENDSFTQQLSQDLNVFSSPMLGGGVTINQDQTLAIDSKAFQSAYDADPADAGAWLNYVSDVLKATTSNYSSQGGGYIQTQVSSVKDSIKQEMIASQSALANLPAMTVNALLQRAIESVAPIAAQSGSSIPVQRGISTFA